jgi:hypothetical protein
LTLSAAVLTAGPARAAACDATTTTWQPQGGSTDWAWPYNWTNGTPTSGSAVFIPAGVTITGVTGSACSLTVQGSGTATLQGSLALDGPGIAVPSATTLSLQGGTYTWPDQMPVLGNGSTGNGIVEIASGATVVAQGVVTIGDITLRVDGGEVRGDATSAKPTLLQQGAGELDWSAGTLAGTLLLDLLTNVDCTGCTIAAGATVSTSSRTAFEFHTGSIDVEGTVVNGGIMRFRPGTSLTGSGTGVLRNAVVDGLGTVPPTLEFGPEPNQQSGPLTGSVTIDKVAVDNAQHIDIALDTKPVLTNSTSAFEPGSVLTDPEDAGGPAGTLRIGSGATVNVSGATTMSNGVILALDDGGDGTHASLHGATSDAKLTGTVTTNQPVPGALSWASGSVSGPLKTDGITTNVSAVPGSGRFLSGLLNLSGPATVGAATVSMRQGASIQVFGQTTINAPGARFDPAPGSTGQSVTVESGGTLRHVPQDSTATTAPGEVATINVPLVNQGRVELDASLDVPGGYSQSSPAQLSTGASPPVTALLGGSTLSSSAAIAIGGGGVGGKGTIRAPTLSVQHAWLAPGYRAKCKEIDAAYSETCVGTLTVAGVLHLTSTSDVQVVVRSATDHDRLVTTGAATLGGTLTTATGTNYKPTAGLTVTKVVRYPSRTGAFATTASPSAPVGLGFKPSYDDTADSNGRGVDVHLVDTQAPVLGFAGIPAFTQQTSIEIVYAAVDNSSGVASYDVRWRRVGLTGGFSKWVYPKTWWHTKKKTQVITGAVEGYTYCASVRARDNAGNVTRWTSAPCSARQVDDRFLRAVGHWTRFSGRTRWYDKTFSRATARGATLVKYGTFTRVAVSAYHCPTCGTLRVYAGGRLLKTLYLKSAKYGRTNFVSSAIKRRTAHVYLKVVSRHRLVQIDALGLLH